MIQKPEDFQYISDKLDRVLRDIIEKINQPMKLRSNVTNTFVITHEDLIGADTTNGTFTITLPKSSLYEHSTLIIKDEGGSCGTNTLTVSVPTGSSDTIDGSVSATITSDYGVLRLYATGSSWFSF